jgi:hypothetical protein
MSPRLRFALPLSFLLLAGGLCAPLSVRGEDRDERFAEANRFYEAGDYEASLERFQSLLDDASGLSPHLFFNLGNTCFRLGRLGEACLHYRRAEHLDPRMSEASQNLRFLRKKVGFLEFDDSGLERAAARLTPSEWSFMAWAGAWSVAIGSIGLLLHRPRAPWNGIAFGSVIGGAGLALIALIGAGLHRESVAPANLHLVVRDGVTATTGPFPDASAVIALPPGSEVKVEAERDRWLFVRIPGKRAGWIERQSVEPLWPWSVEP